jgi:peptidoglycan/LPS O-acetylase OafA/YrhL
MNRHRQHHLDSLRGIAALIVVLSHYVAAFYPYAIYGLQGNYQQKSFWEDLFFFPPFGLLVAGHFAVSLFFILSGYVLSFGFLGEFRRMDRLVAAALKRPIRLGGLVFFTIIAGYGLWHGNLFYHIEVADISGSKPWFSQYWEGEPDLSTLAADIATSLFSRGSTYNPPLWSIKVELYGSLLVFLFTAVFGRFKYRLLILLLLLCLFYRSFYAGFILGMIAADIVQNHHFLSWTSNRYVSLCLLSFFLYFSSYPYCADSAFIRQTACYALPVPTWIGRGFPLIAAFALFVLVLSSRGAQKYLTHPIWIFFGKISYGVYAVHFLVLGSLSSYLFLTLSAHFGYAVSFLLILLSGLPIIIFLAYFSTKYIDEPAIWAASRLAAHMLDFLKSKRCFDMNGIPHSDGRLHLYADVSPCGSIEDKKK